MSLWTQVEKRGAAAILFALLWFGQALAQSMAPLTNNEISKETENPVTRQITVPLRYQADFLDGADQFTKYRRSKSIRQSRRSGSTTIGR